MTIFYLFRHATADVAGINVPYDKFPRPSLSLKGRTEAVQLGRFVIKRLVVELYHNPFECCKQTAQIICKISKMPCIEDCALCEWASNELESNVLEHILTALST